MAGAEANGPEQRRKTNGTREWKLLCDSKFQQRSCQSNRHGHSPRTALTRAPATATECIYSTILVVCRSICCMDCDSVRSGVRGHCHCRSLSRTRSSAPARTVPVDTGDWTGSSPCWLAASTWRLVTDMAFGIFRKPGRWIFSYRFLALDF